MCLFDEGSASPNFHRFKQIQARRLIEEIKIPGFSVLVFGSFSVPKPQNSLHLASAPLRSLSSGSRPRKVDKLEQSVDDSSHHHFEAEGQGKPGRALWAVGAWTVLNCARENP